jgi:hypothetical protein
VRLLASIACALAAALLIAAKDSVATSPLVTYVIRADMRLCASPRCGGWFLQRVNHAQTRCLGGELRTRCYVASIDGTVLTGALFLARGRLSTAMLPGSSGYATLELSQAWSPTVGTATGPGVVYRARDNGVRCIAAPCFSFDARPVERSSTIRLSDVDLSGVRLTPAERRRATGSSATVGLLVTGRIVAVPEAGPAGTGRALVASEVWLEVP